MIAIFKIPTTKTVTTVGSLYEYYVEDSPRFKV
jgi:hypothetical protein